MVARRNWTRRWFDAAAEGPDELVTSLGVTEELRRGRYDGREAALAMMSRLPLLPLDDAVASVIEVYLAERVMPQDPGGDALHLAAASHHGCDFLVTWNCRHIANANKFDRIRGINTKLGLANPALVTPLAFLNEDPTP